MILVIDNFDSFVHNLARYLRQLGFETKVVRNDQLAVQQIRDLAPQAIVLSPGPCTPNEAGVCLSVVEHLQDEFPILGICLGHQVIIQAFGGSVVRALEPMHGRVSQIDHRGTPLFANLPTPFAAGRYHSLVGEPTSLPDCLQATAFCGDRTIMAVEHLRLPIVGLQFHPESILTEHGYQLLENFFDVAGVSVPQGVDSLSPRALPADSRDKPYPISPRLTQRELP